MLITPEQCEKLREEKSSKIHRDSYQISNGELIAIRTAMRN